MCSLASILNYFLMKTIRDGRGGRKLKNYKIKTTTSFQYINTADKRIYYYYYYYYFNRPPRSSSG